jgi:ABC-2 type transport system ATP-binding protein
MKGVIAVIEITDLVKRFGSFTALNRISFKIEKGEVVGFLGPNGAGKSTTMNILTGFMSPTSGTVKVDGYDIIENPEEAKKRIGFLPEQPPLYTDMKVGEYLDFVYELKKCTLAREAHLAEIMNVTKTAQVKDRLIGNLSKGYRQRVGIAQALIGNPPVMIFDEPTVGLDPKQVIEIRSLLRTLGRNHTVILSTHILSEVQAICGRILMIKDGEIVADEKTENIARAAGGASAFTVRISGPQREVLSMLRNMEGVARVEVTAERELDAYTYRVESKSGIDVRKPMFNALAKEGWPILSLTTAGTSLEDVFIKLTD